MVVGDALSGIHIFIQRYFRVSQIEKNGTDADECARDTFSGRESISRTSTPTFLLHEPTDVSPADSRYRTGDLAPPSVTDSTTKLLELDPEGETTTLPKK